MTQRRSFLVLFRLWAVVLLAAIGLQVAEPVRAPLERMTGSAFSAATADVALASSRRTEVAAPQAVPTPPAPPMALVSVTAPSYAAVRPADRLRPEARGPPPRASAERLPDLRGPPLA